MESHSIPTILMNEQEIVDVGFTEWELNSDGRFDMIQGVKFRCLKSDIDHIVYETPVGCFEQAFYGFAGSDLELVGPCDFGYLLPKCRRITELKPIDKEYVSE